MGTILYKFYTYACDLLQLCFGLFCLQRCTIVWETRVVGWEVMYGAEFVPENKEGYTVIIQKPRKMASGDEPVVSQSFKVGEVGKILLTVDNPTSNKKILIYRFKVKPLPCE